jgi:uncharacterized OsmC-like protein
MPAVQVTPALNTCYRVAVGGHQLTIDQPATAGGDNRGPTPLQLLAASLVACTAHYAASYLDRHGLSREGLVVEGDFDMAADKPPRLATMSVTITPPSGLSARRQAGLLAVASHCTVHNTLRQPPAVHIGMAPPRPDNRAGGHHPAAGAAIEPLAQAVSPC